jgi:outer membrane immunogenic protein
MIRKSHIVCVLLSLASTSSLASGFYIGAGLGPDFGKFDVNANVSEIHNGAFGFNVRDEEESSATGIFGTIFAGYGHKFSNLGPQMPNTLYLAGELNANLSSLKHSNSNSEFVHKVFSNTSYRIRDSVGISVLPGIFYSDTTLFYGRLGYSNGNFKVSTSDTSLANINKNLNGFRWGLGLQQALTPRFSARVEFSQIAYGSTTVSTLDPLSAVSKTTKFSPYTDEVEFGVAYHFC